MKRGIHALLFFIFAGILLLSGMMLLRGGAQRNREREANLLLAEKVRQAGERQEQDLCATSPGKEEENTGPPAESETPVLPEYRELWEKNNDLAGWLTIEDLGIDYPVMYTPDEPEYYLHRGFDRRTAEAFLSGRAGTRRAATPLFTDTT